MAEVRLTAEGIKKYEDRLEYLKNTARSENAEEIKIARSFGDLSENAEYDAAKLEQSRIEFEIAEIEALLKNVVLIEETTDTDTVNVGSFVTIDNLSAGMQMDIQIVGSAEADPYAKPARVSNESPVGKGLLGHAAGDTVDIHAPGGVMQFRVIKIGKD